MGRPSEKNKKNDKKVIFFHISQPQTAIDNNSLLLMQIVKNSQIKRAFRTDESPKTEKFWESVLLDKNM